MSEDAHRTDRRREHDSEVIVIRHDRCIRPTSWRYIWAAVAGLAAVGSAWVGWLTLDHLAAARTLAVETERSLQAEKDRVEMKADLKELLRRTPRDDRRESLAGSAEGGGQ